MVAAGLQEATEAVLRDLARAVPLHRRGGGALDALPARQQELLRAMDEAQRRFFLEELAEADTEAGRGRFRAALGRWRDRRQPGTADPAPDSEGVPWNSGGRRPEARRTAGPGQTLSLQSAPVGFGRGRRVRARPSDRPSAASAQVS